MKELLLEKDLRNSGEDSEVRSVARARTLAVLREVNETRKTSVMRFLIEAELIGEDATVSLKGRELEVTQKRNVINLNGADLSGASLSQADLVGANLHGSRLRWANLIGANLSQADLFAANLFGADLRLADLRLVGLSEALLPQADLSMADLRGADLIEADLREADLRGANLTNAKYNTEPYKDEFGIHQPTQWPADFDPVAAGAIDVSKTPQAKEEKWN